MHFIKNITISRIYQIARTQFTCTGNYFNGDKGKTLLSGDLKSPTSVSELMFKVDGDMVFKVHGAVGADNSDKPTVYEGYEKYLIDRKFMIKDQVKVGSYSVLLPAAINSGASFIAYVTEQSNEGGTTAKLYCAIDE